jgi:uncharacterized membrane protein YfcA
MVVKNKKLSILYMFQYIIELIFGLITGILFGITGIHGLPLLILIFDYFKIDEYKKILGAILFVNLFPISIGSVFEFYKNKQIDFQMGWIILLATIIGGIIGSKLVFNKNKLTNKNIKYISAAFSIITGILFLISALNENN